MECPYPSSISRKQFERIRPILAKARKKTKPCTIDLYAIFRGILYVLKSGCQWRMLPTDFPSWQTCYAYWRKWRAHREGQPSLLEEALKKVGWRGSARPWPERENHVPHR